MRAFAEKLKNSIIAVALIVCLVVVLNFTVVPIGWALLSKFLVGSVLTALGLSVFLLGVDVGIMPMGNHTGVALTKTDKLWIIVISGLILGFFISIAEPGLMVLAEQVGVVTSGQISNSNILLFVSVGLAVFLSIGLIKVMFNLSLRTLMLIIYSLLMIAAIFTPPEFLAIAADSSGATTGIMAVPFILALGIGITNRKKSSSHSSVNEDSFGLVALASAGAIVGVFVLSAVTKTTDFVSDLKIAIETDSAAGIVQSFVYVLPEVLFESFMTLMPLLVIFIVLQFFAFKLKKIDFGRILVGFGYSFIGMVLFFTGVYGGFMDVGAVLGYKLAELNNPTLLIIVGFIIGVITMIAEPAVYVQTQQIEFVTSGYIKRAAVLVPLCFGVGIAVSLSLVRELTMQINLWHYLLPGYIIALGLMFFTPKLFIGISFDAGGVATGPLTATFTLAFAQGVAARIESANLLRDGFGMIAMVALTPIITLQILGLIFKLKSKKQGIAG